MQHPLECTWSMWYFKNDKNKDWKNNLKFIASCSTVEDFWALYNHLKSPASLQAGCDYSFFKDNIRPMWEDERNVEGGRWLVNLSRQQRSFELEKPLILIQMRFVVSLSTSVKKVTNWQFGQLV